MSFEWPWLLLTLGVLPLLVLGYVLAQRRRPVYAMRFTNLELLRHVTGRSPGWRRHVPPVLFAIGLTLLLVSLARPQAVIAVPREQNQYVLILDVSGSMSATDLGPNRLEAAKEAARVFITSLPEDSAVGLVTFSSGAYLNAPVTRDREQLLAAIDGLQAGGGTAVGEGVHLALDQLGEREVQADGAPAPALAVLLSDGESSEGRDPLEAAQRALAETVPIYTVGIGQRGATALIGGGQRVGLDEATLQRIATETGGQYFYAADAADLARIYETIGSQVGFVEERTEITALVSGLGVLLFLVSGGLALSWFQRLP